MVSFCSSIIFFNFLFSSSSFCCKLLLLLQRFDDLTVDILRGLIFGSFDARCSFIKVDLFFSFFNYFVNLNEIDFSYNNITDNGVINFSSVINDLVDNISYINISNNKLSAALKCFFEELGIPFNVIY